MKTEYVFRRGTGDSVETFCKCPGGGEWRPGKVSIKSGAMPISDSAGWYKRLHTNQDGLEVITNLCMSPGMYIVPVHLRKVPRG